jgi:hypothetical protein
MSVLGMTLGRRPAIARFTRPNMTHDRALPAGALIVLLLWIFYSAQIFLLGAEFTRAWAQSNCVLTCAK